jgi:hypothetical protein
MIPVDSEGILRWDRCHWKLYEILVPTIYRTSKSDSVYGQSVNFGEVRFWNPRLSNNLHIHQIVAATSVNNYMYTAVLDDKKHVEKIVTLVFVVLSHRGAQSSVHN